MKYFVKALQNYANFNGRATRPEFWYFYLFAIIFTVIAAIIGVLIHFPLLGNLVSLCLLLPNLAVGVRRIHDTNDNGWYILVPIYNLILLCTKGTEGENQYGPDPNGEGYTFDFENKEAGV